MADRLPKTLYHYCSIETFFHIIKTKAIWLSDIEKSNDSLELQYLKKEYAKWAKIICHVFADHQRKTNTPFDEKRLEALSSVLSDISSLTITKTWVFCLSEKGDLLSQWRGYADDGYGVSIGFDARYLSNAIDAIAFSAGSPSTLFTLSKIIYSEKQMKDAVNNILRPLKCAECTTLDELQENLTAPLSQIEPLSPFYKSESFKEEKEWRIVCSALIENTCDYMKINKSNGLISLSNFDYIQSNKKLISHFELGFMDLKKAVTKIILGPKCKISVEEMRYFLISMGLLNSMDDQNIEIATSSSSYR